jgi:hypothetical protein
MGKENENIHVFMVEEEYRRRKIKQNANNFLRKAEPLILDQQNHESVIQELKKQHSNFEVNQEDETLRAPQVAKLIDTLQIAESPNSINDLDLLTSLQKMKTEEQALLEQKQRLVATEQNLHNKLVKEIERKKTTIANLTSEITDLQNRTKQLEEALDIDIYNKTQTLA